MNCPRATKLLPLHVGNDLDPALARELGDHLRTCLTCARALRAFGAARDALRGHFLAPGADGAPESSGVWRDGPSLWSGIEARLAVPGPAAPGMRWVDRTRTLGRIAAAVLAAIGLGLATGWGLGWFDGGDVDRPGGSGGATVVPLAGQAGVVEIRDGGGRGTLRRVHPDEFRRDDQDQLQRLLIDPLREAPRRAEGDLANHGRTSY